MYSPLDLIKNIYLLFYYATVFETVSCQALITARTFRLSRLYFISYAHLLICLFCFIFYRHHLGVPGLPVHSHPQFIPRGSRLQNWQTSTFLQRRTWYSPTSLRLGHLSSSAVQHRRAAFSCYVHLCYHWDVIVWLREKDWRTRRFSEFRDFWKQHVAVV